MAEDSARSVELTRSGLGSYEAVNPRGGRIRFGNSGEDFTPVELR